MFGRLRKLLLTTTALVPLGLAPAAANPLGAQVVGGSATVQGQDTATVTVTQQSNSAIINWNTFNIGTGEKTNIVMPNSNSVQLDRVTGGLGQSQILGSLWSNGRVFLVNPDGILFGSGAKVDTAGFLATTHDIANSDFMAGRYNFSIPGRPDASVVNQGTITAQTGGFAALVAPGVRNSGTITATLGTVALASGNGFTLDFYGDKLITLGVNDSIAAQVKDVATGQTLNTLVKNEGTLQANGGRVELTAVAARQVVDSVINNTGVIEANSIGTHNGMIVLGAATAASKPASAPTQTVKVSGTLSAAGKKKGTTGGTVVVTGENIVVSGATIDASGVAGGGNVLIGGDVGGGHPNPAVAFIPQAQLQPYAVPTASTVTVDAATTINASATDTGNSGKVVVWADQSTLFDGSILVRGGPLGGNGGFVETSGHQQLAFNGTVDLAAPNGRRGTLLLDPQDVTIASTGSWIVTPAALEAALASGDVIVTTGTGSGNGDITVAENVSWSNASALTLNAYRNIAVNANITNTGGAPITLRADDTGTGVGTVSFGSGAQVSTAGPVSIFYNPSVNPAGSVVNTSSYVSPIENYSGNVTGGATLSAYMLVNTVYDLQNIRNNLSGNYALGKDINASVTASWNGGAGFLPIGKDPNFNAYFGFAGLFDGLNHTIDGLFINSVASGFINSAGNFIIVGGYVGLFMNIESSGAVSNLGLTNVSVANSGCAPCNNYTGGISAINGGRIQDSYVTGSVALNGGLSGYTGGLAGFNGGTIDNSYSTASVSALNVSYHSVGGLVGNNGGQISKSYATGAIIGSNFGYTNSFVVAGGLVGDNSGTITSSYATGAVTGLSPGFGLQGVGGLVGHNQGSGTIQTSYATGSVGGAASGYFGGLVGYNENAATIIQSYATGLVQQGSQSGGLVGFFRICCTNTGTYSNNYWDIQTTAQTTDELPIGSTGLTTSNFKTGLPSGFDPTVWGISATINNGYPYLLWQTATSSTPPPTILTGSPGPGSISITVTADSLFKVYGAADPLFTYHITSGSLSGSDAFSGTLTRVSGQNVGTYAINLGTLALPLAYTLTYVGATLTITPVSLTITANDKSRPVGAVNPTFTASYSGFVGGDGPSVVSGLTLSTPATTNSPAGTYSILPGGASALNYTISYVNGLLTVTPATNTTPSVPPNTLANVADFLGLKSTLNPPINWQIAESTPSVTAASFLANNILGSLGVQLNRIMADAGTRNSRAIEYVLTDTTVLASIRSLLEKPAAIALYGPIGGTMVSIIENIRSILKDAGDIFVKGDYYGGTLQIINQVSSLLLNVLRPTGAGVSVADMLNVAGSVATVYTYGFFFGPNLPQH